MSSISSFDIINVAVQILIFFLCIPAYAADPGAVNPNEIKTLLANDLITFFVYGSRVFNNGPRSLPRIHPDCIILNDRVFDSLFAKASRIFAACLLFNNDLCGKLILSSELPIIFDDNLKTTFVLFFIADCDLLKCEFDSFTFKLLHW